MTNKMLNNIDTSSLGFRDIPKVCYTGRRGRPKTLKPGEFDPHESERKNIEQRFKLNFFWQTESWESSSSNYKRIIRLIGWWSSSIQTVIIQIENPLAGRPARKIIWAEFLWNWRTINSMKQDTTICTLLSGVDWLKFICSMRVLDQFMLALHNEFSLSFCLPASNIAWECRPNHYNIILDKRIRLG